MVETICLFGAGARVIVVALGLALFKIFGAETCLPSMLVFPVPAFPAATR